MPRNALQVLLRKGNIDRLSGNVLVYARVQHSPGARPTPWDDLIRGGMIAVYGQYQNHMNLKDFLIKEMGQDPEALAESLQDRDDPQAQKLRELLSESENTDKMEIIPIPAKVVFFETEEELLEMDADIFFVGEFQHTTNAHLAISAFPILYQAALREQQSDQLDSEIQQLLHESGIALPSETEMTKRFLPSLAGTTYLHYHGDLKELFWKRLIPELVHSASVPGQFSEQIQAFRAFLGGYPFEADLNAIEAHLLALAAGYKEHQKPVELLCQKIAALRDERFEEVRFVQSALEQWHQEHPEGES
jgi:hypothetical protein